jgi:hypothetical protein
MKSFNEFLQNETIKSKWEKTRLLEGLPSETTCHLALESQKLHNEADVTDNATFKRLSIPLIRRIFSHLSDKINGSLNEVSHWMEVADFNPPQYQGGRGTVPSNLNSEVDYTAELAQHISDVLESYLESGETILFNSLQLRNNKIYANFTKA